MAPRAPKQPTPVETYIHGESRTNIPTNELREFAATYETTPTVVRYPRDAALDPQLVWKGKEEQNAQELAVEVVPIYIQEKIHPQALVEQLKKPDAQPQLDLFATYDTLTELGEKVEFYQHDEKWQNRMILGDSLVVMTSLAEKEGLKGKVQTIYIDPPYGIKFGSNWQVSTRKRDVKDGKAEDATRQPEQVRAFRDTWQLGIHSYLAYLRDRLTVARELLTESGSIFVQIGDENVHLVRNLMDEVFGSDNFVSEVVVAKTSGFEESGIASVNDFLVWYAKEKSSVKARGLFLPRSIKTISEQYKYIESPSGSVSILSRDQITGREELPIGRRFMAADLTGQGESSTAWTIEFNGRTHTPTRGRHWSTNAVGIERLRKQGRLYIVGGDGRLAWKRYAEDSPYTRLNNLWTDTAQGGMGFDKVYVVQTIDLIIQRCLLMTTDPGDLVLDPTCGSGTTAYVAEQWGRRWITVDTSRVALALARTRLMAAKYPYYLLSDSPEGVRKESEITGITPPAYPTQGDIRKGFVYKRVPHVTLKSIANNAQIDDIHAAFQEDLETQRTALNTALNQTWQEWEIPRTADEKWDPAAQQAHAAWWKLRRERQTQIDDSIARAADVELLYDQPYEDNKRVRVSGPFTVESLSPHRMLSADDDSDGALSQKEAQQTHDFAAMILDNLRKAGVQNTKKGERLVFETLEPFAGAWIQAEGTYKDADEEVQRVAVSIGPEYGTVGAQQIREAAKEAIKGIGFDLLVVCGFAFDPYVDEAAKQIGRLTVLPARMNPDLAMGGDLLKKTGAGNLFMVFGEPDIDVKKKGDEVVVELRGLDVYDPTTGSIRSSSTDDIACWFIDTDYDEESFFVRHAYFTGADEPYDKLKRALKAEVDEDAWQSLYKTVSRPFPKPTTGKIAVKVINHYGDEVLKVYSVA